MKFYILTLLLATSSGTKLQQRNPFTLDGEVLDVDIVPDIPDPINYAKIHSHDDALIHEAEKEIASAERNEKKGDINREMAMALLESAKTNVLEVNKSIKTQLSSSENQLASDVRLQSFIDEGTEGKNFIDDK